ncbi:MAG TPA: hypothetical protein VLV87_06900 [Gammaproteobacteria bacterium]|nr:hypothetical protein [Gammaproteobacteria bacterium]
MNSTRFVFKANRDYLHSTTAFDYIRCELDGTPLKIDFRFNRRTDHVCALTDKKPPDNEPPVATYTDSERTLYLVETPGLIAERVAYDEDGLAANFKIEDKSIHVPADIAGYSFIECAVAAYKRLLTQLFGKQRYAFVRLSVDRIPDGAFQVGFSRQLSEGFYQGVIKVQEVPVGRIFFGRWQ